MNQSSKAAKILGRLGGLKGGRARAEKLTPERRKEIAQKAIAARWAKRKAAKSNDVAGFDADAGEHVL